jgi:outer membrane protein OmpA-like peptidoglycan-associated protein
MKRILSAAVLTLSVWTTGSAQDTPGITAYSKVDFVSGSSVVLFEDFKDDAIGDFPDGWDTNASAEVVTIEGRSEHWLMLSGGGIFVPILTEPLPDYFTFEFDLVASTPFTAGSQLSTSFAELPGLNQAASWHGANNRYTYSVHPSGTSGSERRQESVGEPAVQTEAAPFADRNGGVAHVAAWRTRERMRVYVNDRKVWDIPRAMVPTGNYNSIVFYVPPLDESHRYYLTNLRLAVGAPDTRNRLVTEGSWTTHGILFDVNSDRIRGESYGALKEIAGVLGEELSLRVRIVGHTDSDGDDAANMDLSRRRADAVKEMLATEFGIQADRMQTEGRGEAEPDAPNDTAAGKANNRRVEFVRI